MNIYIDPRSTINYSSYYIQGLYDLFGKNKVHFTLKHFTDLSDIDIDMLMAFVIVDEESNIKKYIIDYRDQDDIINGAYQWSNIYAKINVDIFTFPKDDNKGLIIAPSFGIKIWNLSELFLNLINNFFKGKIYGKSSNPNIHLRPKIWIRNYLSLIKRQKLSDYKKQQKDTQNSRSVFFVSSYWKEAKGANLYRRQYIMSCFENKKIDFSGGFFIGRNISIPNDIPDDLLFYKFYSNKAYLSKIAQSIFVFNTPAVHNCHGWKLGEFLCLGKAIISTPLKNQLPFPLNDKEDIYFVNDYNELKNAISELAENKELREKFERNSYKYYEQYTTPLKVVEQIISK